MCEPERNDVDVLLATEDASQFSADLMTEIGAGTGSEDEGLPESLRTAILIYTFELETSSGGFAKQLTEGEPRVLAGIQTALEQIGAVAALSGLREAIAVTFPAGAIP